MDKTWGYWLNEPIFTDKGVINILKRKHALYRFCMEGILPFLESKGYFVIKNDTEFYKCILQVLFTLYQGKKVIPYKVDYSHSEDHYNMFIHTIDTSVWSSFWSRWDEIQDFERDAYGAKLKTLLPALVWSWIDFDNSKTIRILERELIEYDEQDEFSKGKDDPYLQETSRRDYQDRHW